MSDLRALGISFIYVLLVVGLAEGLRRTGRVSFDHSRKIIHIGIGTWILPTVLIFDSRLWAALPPAVFTAMNLLSLRNKWSRAMDAEAGENAGTVFFPLSFVLLILPLWGSPAGKAAITAGILSMAWGDAAAALIGRRWGRRRYRAGRNWRTMEGSAAMVAVSALAIAVAGRAVGSPFPWQLVAGGAVLAGLLEGASRKGADNLLVPLGTGYALWGALQLF